jgi:hypothetical protein
MAQPYDRYRQFKLSRRGRSRVTKAPPGKAIILKDPKEQGPYFIRGMRAGSKEEY